MVRVPIVGGVMKALSTNVDAVVIEILKDFLTVRSLITLGAFGTVYVMTWAGQPVPDIVIRIVDLLLGFWFGTKAGTKVVEAAGRVVMENLN